MGGWVSCQKSSTWKVNCSLKRNCINDSSNVVSHEASHNHSCSLFSVLALHTEHGCMYVKLLKWHLIIVLITMVISATQYDHYLHAHNFDCRLRIVEWSLCWRSSSSNILLPFLFCTTAQVVKSSEHTADWQTHLWKSVLSNTLYIHLKSKVFVCVRWTLHRYADR